MLTMRVVQCQKDLKHARGNFQTVLNHHYHIPVHESTYRGLFGVLLLLRRPCVLFMLLCIVAVVVVVCCRVIVVRCYYNPVLHSSSVSRYVLHMVKGKWCTASILVVSRIYIYGIRGPEQNVEP